MSLDIWRHLHRVARKTSRHWWLKKSVLVRHCFWCRPKHSDGSSWSSPLSTFQLFCSSDLAHRLAIPGRWQTCSPYCPWAMSVNQPTLAVQLRWTISTREIPLAMDMIQQSNCSSMIDIRTWISIVVLVAKFNHWFKSAWARTQPRVAKTCSITPKSIMNLSGMTAIILIVHTMNFLTTKMLPRTRLHSRLTRLTQLFRVMTHTKARTQMNWKLQRIIRQLTVLTLWRHGSNTIVWTRAVVRYQAWQSQPHTPTHGTLIKPTIQLRLANLWYSRDITGADTQWRINALIVWRQKAVTAMIRRCLFLQNVYHRRSRTLSTKNKSLRRISWASLSCSLTFLPLFLFSSSLKHLTIRKKVMQPISHYRQSRWLTSRSEWRTCHTTHSMMTRMTFYAPCLQLILRNSSRTKWNLLQLMRIRIRMRTN